MIIKKLTNYTTEYRFQYASGFKQKALLLTDIHWDNPKCDRPLLKRLLEEAKTSNALIFIFGDLFCCMQGKYDKRGSKSSLRPEHQGERYFDLLVDTATEYFMPYRENIALITPGNHETAILGRHETDLIGRLTKALDVPTSTYQGWCRFTFEQEKSGGGLKRLNMAYHHGYGGGGPVTKDIIQTNRKAVYLPDADIVVSGHTHDQWIFPMARVKLLDNGQQVENTQYHIKCGHFKDEFECGYGWAVEKGMPPKMKGGMWMEFKYWGRSIVPNFMLAH